MPTERTEAGREGMKRPDITISRELDHPWHVAINEYVHPHRVEGDPIVENDGKHFMYEAKDAATEVPRLTLLFGRERRGELPKIHHQCSHDHAGQPVPDNHLTCCLGVECRACPHLAAIDRVQRKRDYTFHPSPEIPVTDEERDVMKAWTCVTHILMRGGDLANEGFVLTTDDQLYWQNVYTSLAAGDPAEDDK